MKQFSVLFVKEWREAWRSFKLVWIPLVFLSLGVSDPLVNYFMDDIMGAVGNLPDGYEFTLPDYTPEDLLAATTSQFQLIGLIVLVAIYVGAISRERQSGTAALLYARPLNFASLYLSKLVVAMVVALVSMLLGYAGSVYYTTLLYEAVDWLQLVYMLLTYALWLLFAMAFTLTMSAIFNTAIAAALAIIIIPVGLLIDPLIGSFWVYTPWKLGAYSLQILRDDVNMTHYGWTVAITVICIMIFIFVGIFYSKKNTSKVNY